MELTIDQALQQGVAAHREGKLQDAEKLYRAILQSQPLHPDANHNLGLIAVSFHKADAALPLFKTALESNPKIEQFWLSYIDALIQNKHFDNAKHYIEQAKKHGVDGEKLSVVEAQLAPVNKHEIIAGSVSPSQQQLDILLAHYQAGRLDDAEKLALSLSTQFPRHNFSWKLLGAILTQTGRVSEAVSAGEKSIEIAPDDPDAHFILGFNAIAWV